jgi:hypothetical protein
MVAIGPPAEGGEGPGIITYEFAGSEQRVDEIKEDWGDEGRDAARISLWLDYTYMPAYGAFWALAVAAVAGSAHRRGWARLGGLGARLVPAAIGAALFDAGENIGLLLALGGHGGDAAPLAAAICAAVKFVLIGLVIAYVVGVGIRVLAVRSGLAASGG